MNKLKFGIKAAGMGLMIMATLLQGCNKPVLADQTGIGGAPQISLKKKKTLLIVLDGAVGAAVEEANLPTIKKMLDNSVYSFYGLIDTISNDGTTWADLVTGTRLNKHNVKTESFASANFVQYPSFLKRLKDNDKQFRAVAFTTLPLLATGLFGAEMEKHQHLPDNDLAAKDSTVNRLKSNDADLLLVDFSLAERVGKTYGFGTGITQYRTALQTLDSYIDEMIYTLQHRDTYEKEDWLVVVTSTHGGKPDGSYGGNASQDRNVFSIYYSPNLKKTAIPRPLINLPYEGNFMYFSNPGNRYTQTSNPAYKLGSQNFTVEFRVKSAGGTSDPAFISNKDWNSGANPGWAIFRTNNSNTWGINLANQARSRKDLTVIGIIGDNKWHMLSASFNRTGLLSAYQDGVLSKTADISSISSSSVDGPYPLVVGDDGTRVYNGSGTGSINSYITNVRIWNTVLPADVIKDWQYLDITSSHPFYNNLIGYWKMDDASGTLIKDYSKTGADMVLTGNATRPFVADILNPSTVDTRILTPGLIDHSFRIMTWMGMRVDYQAWALDGKVWSGN
ncbi:LamG-like jellyroll fold domain-containing protein [Niabella sp.]|uniref:LamG-like jellyroll fold domain-containing protein n=1 Tax=Niabella sp. TaxID=1962976 RepID=UPI0026209115|nr:LamG-like jellyroll fold domain-containing protein [Niabella sp.]